MAESGWDFLCSVLQSTAKIVEPQGWSQRAALQFWALWKWGKGDWLLIKILKSKDVGGWTCLQAHNYPMPSSARKWPNKCTTFTSPVDTLASLPWVSALLSHLIPWVFSFPNTAASLSHLCPCVVVVSLSLCSPSQIPKLWFFFPCSLYVAPNSFPLCFLGNCGFTSPPHTDTS